MNDPMVFGFGLTNCCFLDNSGALNLSRIFAFSCDRGFISFGSAGTLRHLLRSDRLQHRDDFVGNSLGYELHRFQRIVIGGNGKINQIRVTVGIHDGADGNAETASFGD